MVLGFIFLLGFCITVNDYDSITVNDYDTQLDIKELFQDIAGFKISTNMQIICHHDHYIGFII